MQVDVTGLSTIRYGMFSHFIHNLMFHAGPRFLYNRRRLQIVCYSTTGFRKLITKYPNVAGLFEVSFLSRLIFSTAVLIWVLYIQIWSGYTASIQISMDVICYRKPWFGFCARLY